MAGDGGGRGHDRADQMRAAVFALAAFEIAIRRAGAAFVRWQNVRVHADAHAAARVAPLESGGGEDFVEPFFFGLGLDAPRAGDDQRLLNVLRYVLAFDKMRGGAEIIEARIGARADEHAVHGNIHDGCAGLETHVFERALRGFLIVEILEVVRIRYTRGHARHHAGIRAPGDLRSDLLGVELDGHVKLRAVVGLQLLPALDGFLKRFATRDKRPAFEVSKSGLIRRDHAGARAAFDRHVADGHASVHGKGAHGFAAVFGDVAVAAGDASLSDNGENQVLGGDAPRALAVDENVQCLRARLNKTLCCKDVLDFAGADAESQRAERAVRGSVAIAADKGLAGLSDAEFRANDVHDALILAIHVEEANAGLAAVFLEGVKLELGIVIEDRQRAVRGGDGMVHHREREIGAADLAAFVAETGESLGRSAFVYEVAVNVDNRRLAGIFANDVRVPDFLVERLT